MADDMDLAKKSPRLSPGGDAPCHAVSGVPIICVMSLCYTLLCVTEIPNTGVNH